ncbi:MAG: hypothetical protein RLZZ234_81 [Candidatus Parcubacteria bacterium]|jgi:hypothetical protein
MLKSVAEPPGFALQDSALHFFAQKFSTNPQQVEETVRAIEEWWFVPRSDEAMRASEERITAACAHCGEYGVLPEAYQQAYAYATSERCRTTEAKLALLQK